MVITVFKQSTALKHTKVIVVGFGTQPVRRRHWYDTLRQVVASVAHESKQLSARTSKNGDDGKCFQPRPMSPCSVGVFCCSTKQPSDECRVPVLTTPAVSSRVSSSATWKCDDNQLQRMHHRNATLSLNQAHSGIIRLRDRDRKT